MLLVKTEVRASPIHGLGVFVLEDIPNGTEVWRLDLRVDQIFNDSALASLPPITRDFIEYYGYKTKGLTVLCADNTRYFNHSEKPNLECDHALGSDFARRDIKAGEELTHNYESIDDDSASDIRNVLKKSSPWE
jgi:SET domain-containing protein